jgi:uncharacterized ParB-like nuclease family protein
MDLGTKPVGFWGQAQYYFHVSHCHPCQAYLKMCRRLLDIVKASRWASSQNLKVVEARLNQINQGLLQKYGQGI